MSPPTHQELLWFHGFAPTPDGGCRVPLFRLHGYWEPRAAGAPRRIEMYVCPTCDRVVEVRGRASLLIYPFAASCRCRTRRRPG